MTTADKSTGKLENAAAFFNPTSVAIIGASQNPDKVGYKILQNILRSGFTGRILPVNPSADSILGIKVYKTLKDCGGVIDQSVIVVPRKFVMDAIQDSISCGVKAITVITAGFKEQDAEGAALELQIAKKCSDAGVVLLGPNCLGHLNTHHPVDLSFGNKWPTSGNMSFISQSGALCCAVLDRAVERGFGLGKMISMGNKAGISEIELIKALGDDKKTEVIVCYLESINNGPLFVPVATEASKKKPIIAFKAGVTASGSKAASSHTGSLAGADIAYETAFKKCGIIRARTYEQMFEHAIAFSSQPLPAGRRVTIITNAGGPGIMAADAIEMSGLTIATLAPETSEKLKSLLPKAASVKNPVDVLGDGDAERYANALKCVGSDPNTDAIIVLLTPQAVTKPVEIAEVLCKTKPATKPVVACFMGGEDVNPGRKIMLANGIPDYRSPEKAVTVLKAMCDYADWKAMPESKSEQYKVDKTKVSEIISSYRKDNLVQINECDAKAILQAYGIKTPAGALVKNAKEAESQSLKIGFPLVMKIVSPDIIHKSDVGGVALNLKNEKDVVDAYTNMMQKINKAVPGARITGVYIEKMSSGEGKETIIGVTRDPQFGPMVMFGLGGIFVELLKDVTFALAPVNKTDALDMIKSIKTFALLNGYRGQPKIDVGKLAEMISRVSQLAADFPEIKELDINPFKACEQAESSMALDGRITLTKV
jgi:acetyltransferase